MSTTPDIADLVDQAEAQFLALWDRGPARTQWVGTPPQVGDPSPTATLPDHEGQEVSLSSLWADRPALVLFWRHFACSCGAARAARLREELADYRAEGAAVVIIGQAEPARAAVWRESNGLDCPVLCDPDEEVYREYGLVEGTVAQVLFDAPPSFWPRDPEVGRDLVRQRREAGNPLVDNPWLLPGEFVVGQGGQLIGVHRYQWCEDFIDPRVHLAALRGA